MYETNLLRAGAAMIDITPPAGTHLSGSGAGEHRPAQAVMDSLFAKAIVFESGERRVCMVILDLTIVTGSYTDQIRAAIGEQTGLAHLRRSWSRRPKRIPPRASATLCWIQISHWRPTQETEYLRGAERAYGDRAAAAAVEAAVAAARQATTRAHRFGARRVRRFGLQSPRHTPGRHHRHAQATGTGAAAVWDRGCLLSRRADGPGSRRVLHPRHGYAAAGLSPALHPVTRSMRSDIPRPIERYRRIGLALGRNRCSSYSAPDAVPLVVNGCCGNINPWHPFDPDCRPDHQRMGRELAQMSERIVHNMAFTNDAALDCKMEKLGLPLREIPAERLREVNAMLAENPQPPRGANGEVDPHWFRAASTHSVELCRQRDAEFPYEIQAFRIGDLGVIGLPGEPFVEGQLALKTNSAAPFLFPAHLTTHYVGYLPTRAAYTRGGHEANEDVTYWAKLAPGSLETVVEQARTLVEELFV